MPGTVLIGLQWGDEGKGKVIDHLAARSDAVVRFQGGGNAGHTVVVGGKKYVLHHLPSGILHPGKTCIIGAGVVVDPAALGQEIDDLSRKDGVRVEGRLHVCWRAHLVLPHHRVQDGAAERRRGTGKIGTTGRGIGPAYADKMARTGLRMGDLLDLAGLERKIEVLVEDKRRVIGEDWKPELEAGPLLAFCRAHAERLGRFVADGVEEVHRLLAAGKEVLFEGAQGALLDVDLGTYPFVTSSSTSVGGVFHGAGISPRDVRSTLGVVKGYVTRVGEGPFPTELEGEVGRNLREKGGEFGATTGRPRRCGWFDAVAGAYAARIDGPDGLAVTKLDVLSGMPEIGFCSAYEIDGRRTTVFDPRPEVLARARPVVETLPGWRESLGEVRALKDLPDACRRYLRRIEEALGAPVRQVSVGPERNQIIDVD
ncbi:MAG: adenylosuccinate synthase [Planctomycetes bacterium]|nr:adenylosuccinate synthase [Planctomycetota bacterium]